MEHVCLGRAYTRALRLSEALRELNHGLELLRIVGQVDAVLLALLARAEAQYLSENFNSCANDLEDVSAASRNEMLPIFVDSQLQAARLYLAQGRSGPAASELAKARDLSRKIGYKHAVRECDSLAEALEKYPQK